MRMHYAFVILLSVTSYASEVELANSAWRKSFPEKALHADDLVFGDLNGDGLLDFASIVGDVHYNERGVENLRVALFSGMKDGGFQLHSITGDFFGHERVYYTLQIKNSSLFVSKGGAGSCCSRWNLIYQFKTYKGILRLIGIEYHDGGFSVMHETEESEDAQYVTFEYGRSVNFITGKAILWRSSGFASENSPYETIGGKRKKEYKHSFGVNQNVLIFNGFDEEMFEKYMGATKGLCGAVKEDLNYSEDYCPGETFAP